MKKIIKFYSKFVSHNSLLVLILSLVLTVIMVGGMQMMQTQDSDYQDMLPENYDVIRAFNLIEEDFGSTSGGTVVIEIDNSFKNSNEVSSVVAPEVVRYSLLLEDYFSTLENVEEVNGLGEIIEEIYGRIPNSINDIREVSANFGGSSFVSEDESMMLIELSLDEDVDGESLTEEVLNLIDRIEKPEGIKVSVSGSVFEDVVVNEQMGPNTRLTSMFSVLAIIIILTLLFRSVKGVSVPLMTIIFGIVWTLGFLGLTNSGLSSMTSGAISMIMGIGIDFGIQVMSRYNKELENNEKKIAMQNTLSGILAPIFTTALACLIGFRAMGLGELSMMAELGTVMSLGVLFCMLAAITIVPSLLVITTRSKK